MRTLALDKTFFNHYILHPLEAETTTKKIVYTVASVAIAVFTLFIAHLIVYSQSRRANLTATIKPDDSVVQACEAFKNSVLEGVKEFEKIQKLKKELADARAKLPNLVETIAKLKEELSLGVNLDEELLALIHAYEHSYQTKLAFIEALTIQLSVYNVRDI